MRLFALLVLMALLPSHQGVLMYPFYDNLTAIELGEDSTVSYRNISTLSLRFPKV
jgi:hypothetical protein